MYKIGEISKQSGFSIQTLRYYEKEKLIIPDGRTDSGYRLYKPIVIAELEHIEHLKSLGFSLSEIRELKDLEELKDVTTRDIKKKAQEKHQQIEQKIIYLKSVKEKLNELILRCPGDETSIDDCPIVHPET